MNRSGKGFKIRVITSCLIVLLCSTFLYLKASGAITGVNFFWLHRSPSIAPPAVFSAEMTYDRESDRTILFSGAISPYVVHNGTWAYDYNTNSWENVTPDISPGGRGVAAMAYDEESDRSILFGGTKKYFDNGTLLEWGDTWAYHYETNTWENMTPEISPRARSIHNMAYDNESDRVILYGGFWGDPSAWGGRRALEDTWVFDYNSNSWTNMNPTTSPGLLYAFGMAYDSESDRVVLYGGKYKSNSITILKTETWVYDFNTNNWTNMDPPTNPGQRNRFQMTYQSQWDRVVLFGGDKIGATYDDSWTYDYNANNWTKLEPNNHPSQRYYSELVYDDESERIILFGGSDVNGSSLNETWSLYREFYALPPMTIPIPPIIDYWYGLLIIAGVIAFVIFMVVRRRSYSNR